MLFNHKNMLKKTGTFKIAPTMSCICHKSLNKLIFGELWHGYSFNLSTLKFNQTEELCFKIGNAESLELADFNYSINITANGVCVTGKTEQDLIHGFMTLIDCIKVIDDIPCIQCGEIKEKPKIATRVIHYCVFPETEIWEIEKFIRFFGALKYTHIILEFWGMLKYDCLKELAWPNGFEKSQIIPLIKLANDLGLEIIPLFNHWGHASACRDAQGKHVVLDQNPSLQYLFNDDGWCWNIGNEKTKKLLKQIRTELIELFGEGEYFHIGCDESYIDFTKESMDEICDYINEMAAELKAEGRKTVIWGDMFLSMHEDYEKSSYYCNCPDGEKEAYMLSKLNPEIIIGDWQYKSVTYPTSTAITLKNAGFNVMLCSWDLFYDNIDVLSKTVIDNNLYGIMHTTWNTLFRGTPYVAMTAFCGWCAESFKDMGRIKFFHETAAILRKVYPVNGDYRKSGWAEKQAWQQ